MIKLICVSDLHGLLPEVPPCDLLLIGGDICPVYNHEYWFQEVWLRTNFSEWLNRLKKNGIKNIVFVAGNHDFFFEKYNHQASYAYWSNTDPAMLTDRRRIYYLQDTQVVCDGLKIWGSPWQLPFYDWAFNLPEEEISKKWELIPKDTDILLLHGPPKGYGDRVYAIENEEEWPGIKHTGSLSLTEKIKEIQPKLVVFGHIHANYGVYHLGETLMVNASIVNEQYKMVNKPWIIESSSTGWRTL